MTDSAVEFIYASSDLDWLVLPLLLSGSLLHLSDLGLAHRHLGHLLDWLLNRLWLSGHTRLAFAVSANVVAIIVVIAEFAVHGDWAVTQVLERKGEATSEVGSDFFVELSKQGITSEQQRAKQRGTILTAT